MRIRIIIITVLVLSVYTVFAQQKYKVDLLKSKLNVEGTSTVHDWIMNSTVFSSTALFEITENYPVNILDVKFTCKADKILSDNSIMDGKTHKALKADDYPEITFHFKSVKSFIQQKDNFSGEISGSLSIAGKTKNIILPFSGKISALGILEIKGSIQLKMTDFGIEPPTAMLGALKTGDDIKVNYDFHFVKTTN